MSDNIDPLSSTPTTPLKENAHSSRAQKNHPSSSIIADLNTGITTISHRLFKSPTFTFQHPHSPTKDQIMLTTYLRDSYSFKGKLGQLTGYYLGLFKRV